MIYHIKGNLLDSHDNYICHQVNCQGKMNSGVAKAIREKWPNVFREYSDEYLATVMTNQPVKSLLGKIQMVPINEDQMVVNLFAQNNYGYDGERYTSYDAFYEALETLRDTTLPGSSYAFPYRIGSDRGGANWKIIETMIDEVFKDRDVYIYQLEG